MLSHPVVLPLSQSIHTHRCPRWRRTGWARHGLRLRLLSPRLSRPHASQQQRHHRAPRPSVATCLPRTGAILIRRDVYFTVIVPRPLGRAATGGAVIRETSSPVNGLLGTTEERTHHPPTPRISPATLAGSAVHALSQKTEHMSSIHLHIF